MMYKISVRKEYFSDIPMFESEYDFDKYEDASAKFSELFEESMKQMYGISKYTFTWSRENGTVLKRRIVLQSV